ncbi:protein of unknown function [Nitrospira japonica]|uniref:Uncharacterized protein n=1 Tax=Nitrospira japonica TaxID=1325564 RepID=A0A1W1I7L3_9BACT|nr:protein of unknown function [Nitrospira japonica]
MLEHTRELRGKRMRRLNYRMALLTVSLIRTFRVRTFRNRVVVCAAAM